VAWLDGFAIAEIAFLDAIDAGLNAPCCLFVAQGLKPQIKDIHRVDQFQGGRV